MRKAFALGSLPALAAMLIAACGGGGGSSTPASTTQPTVVSQGAITGFGSVHLNGQRFVTTSTAFTIDGESGTQSDLRVGHMIRVHGQRHGNDDPSADRIEMHTAVRGPVQSIDAAANSLVVLGQTVIVDADTSFGENVTGSALSGLAVADIAEVSGARRADGAILATRIEKRGASASLRVRGIVSGLDAATHKFSISALVVDYSSATLQHFPSGAPANGDLVEAKGGTLGAGGELLARQVELEDEDDGEAGDHTELEGPITRFVSATDFDVAGEHVTTTASTIYQNGSATDLAVDVKVEAEGAIDASGTLVATKIEFKRRGDARVAGPVDSVNAAAGTLVVLGIDVTVNAMTRVEDKGDQHVSPFGLANLAAGDYVELRGAELPANSNDVVATRLERRRAESEVRLRGVVDTAAAPGFSILGVNVTTNANTEFEDESAANFFDGLVGRTVSVKGTMVNGALVAREVEFEEHGD